MDSSINSVCPSPRNPRACEQCRASKTRCLQSNRAGICQRCLISRKECIFGVRAKRRLKGQNLQSNETTSQNGGSQTTKQSYPSPFDSQPSPSSDDSDDEAPLQKIHSAAFQTFMGDHQENVVEDDVSDPKPTNLDDITKDLLDLSEANRLINRFQEMKSFFPFVIIPDNVTVKTMAQKSPFLLLAVLVVASPHTSDLHRKLDVEFCKLLGVKVIANGEKNLDILQGLLVYIAWYPFHLKLHKQCMYTYLQVAISMSVQLKLDKPSKVSSPTFPLNNNLSRERELRRKAGQRAFLGCHYLSSGVAQAFNKPCTTYETDYVKLCGSSLAGEPEVQTDRLLPLMIAIGYIGSESASLFDSCSSGLDIAYVQVQMEGLRKRLQDCMESIPLEYQNSTLFKLGQQFTRVAIYCSALAPYHDSNVPLANEIRLNALSHCLENTKQFLDYAFNIPTSEYGKFSMVAWGHFIRSLMITLQLSSALSFPQWNSAKARETLQLGTRLDCLCWRIQTLDIQSGKAEKTRTLFSLLQSALSKFKETYDKVVQLDVERTANFQTPDIMDFDSLIDELGLDKCPALHGGLSQFGAHLGGGSSHGSGPGSGIPLYHDMWATMTMSWAP